MQTGGGRGTAPCRWTRVPAPGREGRGPVGEDFPRTGRGPGGVGRGGSGPVDPDRFFSKPPAVVGEDESDEGREDEDDGDEVRHDGQDLAVSGLRGVAQHAAARVAGPGGVGQVQEEEDGDDHRAGVHHGHHHPLARRRHAPDVIQRRHLLQLRDDEPSEEEARGGGEEVGGQLAGYEGGAGQGRGQGAVT